MENEQGHGLDRVWGTLNILAALATVAPTVPPLLALMPKVDPMSNTVAACLFLGGATVLSEGIRRVLARRDRKDREAKDAEAKRVSAAEDERQQYQDRVRLSRLIMKMVWRRRNKTTDSGADQELIDLIVKIAKLPKDWQLTPEKENDLVE